MIEKLESALEKQQDGRYTSFDLTHVINGSITAYHSGVLM